MLRYNVTMRDDAITDSQIAFYHEHGYLVLRGALHPDELARVQGATRHLVDDARPGAPDCHFKEGVLARIEYVVDKDPALRDLLAHPFVLRSVERLMGPDLFPTWDAMVVKMPGRGIAVPWHRDAATDCVGDRPIFNVDFYLDPADDRNGVWAIPGSHRWSPDRAAAFQREHHRADATIDDYRRVPGAVALHMEPGDILFHDILLLHGSPESDAPTLRRVVYYEFRTAGVEAERGPHTPAYIPLKQAVLRGALRTRRERGALPGETPFDYRPPAPWDTDTGDRPPTCRYPHQDFWRERPHAS